MYANKGVKFLLEFFLAVVFGADVVAADGYGTVASVLIFLFRRGAVRCRYSWLNPRLFYRRLPVAVRIIFLILKLDN